MADQGGPAMVTDKGVQIALKRARRVRDVND
jgi:hypothetical protein